MNLIEKLGLEKCKAIVGGAPNLTVVTISTYCADTENYWDGNGQPCGSCIDLNDLRTEIANHERTDYVSDITNHISPNTLVKDR